MAAYIKGCGLADLRVSVAMSNEVYSCGPSAEVSEAEAIMRSRQVRRLPVISAVGELVGMVSLNDLAREAGKQAGRSGDAVNPQDVTSTLAAVTVPRKSSAQERTSRAS